MPSPFCGGVGAELQGQEIQQQDITDSIAASPPNNLGQIAIPTPPPERTFSSPDSTHSSLSHGSCISPQHSASATSDSYIKGSSLEESPVSSPSSSCAGEVHSLERQDYMDAMDADMIPKLIKKERESCIRSTSEQASKSEGETSSNNAPSREQNVPKNIKLPQSKFVIVEIT